VLIVIDTLRADHLEIYGHDRPTAPFLARLAETGTVFDRAHSTSSWTAPSTASLMTGLYPTHHGVVEGFFAHRQRESLGQRDGFAVQPLAVLPGNVRLLAERFADAGFRTFGAATNINIGPLLGFDRGFERFVESPNQPAATLLADVGTWPALQPGSGDRSFLYLHLNDVHEPYEPRADWYVAPATPRDQAMAAYDSEIGYVDHHLEQLAGRLGWDDDTLVVVVSDHGEEFGDHGGRRHDRGLHEELTRIVMIVSGAAVPVGRVDVEVSLIDVLPTLLELGDIDPASEDRLDGRSLVPLLFAEDEAAKPFETRPLLAHRAKMGREHGAHWWAIVTDGWKLIVDGEKRALYDRRTDRRETVDRADEEPERVRTLEARLDTLRRGGIHDGGERAEVVLDDEMVEALEALGYVERDTDEASESDDTSESDESDATGETATGGAGSEEHDHGG